MREKTEKNLKKKLLLIAFYFPPTLTGGVFRPYKFSKYLPNFGWDTSVLTVTGLPFLDQDNDLLVDIPAQAKVHRIPFYSPQNLYKKTRRIIG